MNNLALIDRREDLTDYKGYLALACCIWGGVVIGHKFTPEQTIGREDKIKKALNLYTTKEEYDEDVWEEIEEARKNIVKAPRGRMKKVKKEDHIPYSRNIYKISVEADEIVEVFDNMKDLAAKIQLPYERCYTVVRKRIDIDGYIYCSKGYAKTKYKGDRQKPMRKFNLINVNTGEELKEHTSIDITEKTSITRSTVYKLSKSGKPHKSGWLITPA